MSPVQQFEVLLTRPQAAIMGIVNTTPDSFSDGGQFVDREQALKHAIKLVEEGADILDIGGESTRPGAEMISVEEELERTIPLISLLADRVNIPISIDTSKPQVMKAALEAGAVLVNDVNGLMAEGAIDAVAQHQAFTCIMHKQGTPKNMQNQPNYLDVSKEVTRFLNQRIDKCIESGIPRKHIIIDPGIGFGKSKNHNLDLLNNLKSLISNTQCPLLIGVSRKSLIGDILGRSVDKRLFASIGLAVQSVLNGAKIVRVHDVAETADAIRSVEAVLGY